MAGDLAKLLNALGLILINIVLAAALVDQFWFGDLPCPLCMLQRAAFIAAGFGLALNMIFGPKPGHYGVTILGATAGAAVALRQIVLHIVPGTGSYGNAVLGLHLYTLAFIFFALIVIGSAIMLLYDRQFALAEPFATRLKGMTLFAFLGLVVLAVVDLVATFALCGVQLCPDNPDRYLLLQ